MDTLDGFFSDDAPGEGLPPPLLRVVENPRLPADGGLGLLGALMHAAGSAFALLALAYTVVALVADGLSISMVLLAALSAGRSVVHARVGKSLVEQGPRAADGLNTYALVAGLHAALCLVLGLVSLPGDPPLAMVLVGALALMAWPLLLLVLVRTADLRRVIAAAREHEGKIVGEDRGLTALGILMAVGGVLMLVMCVAGVASLLLAGALSLGFFALLALVVCGLFGVRAWFGLQAGRVALRTRDPQRFAATLDRFNALAVISVGVTGLIVIVIMLFAGLRGFIGIAVAVPVLLAGLAWPRAVRFYAEQNLPEVYFRDPLPGIRRPRDAGLTGLGPVLLASSLFSLLGALGVGFSWIDADLRRLFEAAEFDALAGSSAIVGALVTFAAGWSLFHMIERFRPVAVVYGVVVGGLGVWSVAVSLAAVGDLRDPTVVVVAVLQAVAALTLPLAVLWQALRHEEVGEDAADADLAEAFD